MALRNILNHCVLKIKPYRQFSSSTIISKNLYKPSLPILSTPWLMLPPDVKDGPNGPTDNYWNIIDKLIIKIDRPIAHGSVPFNTTCVGSAKGWVAFQRDSNGSLFLANPYTESRCHMFPAVCPHSSEYPRYRQGLQFTLAGDPMSNNFRFIEEEEVRFDRLYLVAYNRKADTVYTLPYDEIGVRYPDDLHLYTWSHFKKEKTSTFISLSVNPEVLNKYFVDEEFWWCDTVEKYLVVAEENNPRLFVVIRHLAKTVQQCETKDIQVFEIELEGDRGEVKCVESIGDKALFIGRNSEPFFISTRDCLGLKSNCVYVAEDLGYFDLETKCITPFISLGDIPNIRPQVCWVAPPFSS